ncbi:Outer membrane protein [hydrothermal vent metagenome]|uniref:Outer membrane protein n=1 Tax=hydrothermal vent metagenome TaxID=652676 RepID=A0A1W1BLI3_9ZZZZ
MGIGVEKVFNVGSTYHQNISRINSYEFFLQNKSRVEIYVNDRYRNALNLIEGTHNLYDLNLPSGLNRVKLKIIEDGGKIEYLEFNDFSYSEILEKGVMRYGAGVGIESKLESHEWEYQKDKKVASAYVEYGLFDSITVESGVQTAEDYLAGDLELLIGTNFGLFNPYVIASQADNTEGYKKGLDYRTNIGNISLNLGFQDTDEEYRLLNSSSGLKSRLYRGNIYSQIGWGINMGLSASQYTKDGIEEDKYGATLTKSIGKWLTQLDFDQTDKEGKDREKQIYISAEYRFGQNRARYINYIEDEKKQHFNLSHNSKGRYGLSSEFQYENSDEYNKYNLRNNFDDEKFRINTTYNLQDNREVDSETQSFSVQLATGMVFAGDKATITAPLSSSFVIVDNDDKLETPLGLMGYQENDEFIYDNFAVSISDYAQRELTVDESELDFGTDLEDSQQKFVSNYKSGSIMKIAVQNLYSVKGVFYSKATKEPLKYKAFKIFNTLTGERSNSFCNEKGEFIINQAEAGKYNVTFMRERGYEGVARFSFEIKEDEKQERLRDLGDIYIEMPKKKEAKKYLIYNKKSNKTISDSFTNILQNIYFDTNSYALSKKAKIKLDNIAIELKKQKNIKLDIIGHSDSTDSKEYNMEISHRRATSVKSYLEEQGVNSSQLNALGVGTTQPISSEPRENRRAEFKGQVTFQVR